MIRLFSANEPADEPALQLLKSMLEREGIACVVRNELLPKGETPPQECVPELWVLDDEDCSKAKEVMDDWRQSTTQPQASWWCAHCKEAIAGQFTSCWRCGKERGEA
jgi:hypothetical protein